MRAFQAAKGAHKGGTKGEDYVERIEFRLLLVYLRQYFEVWKMFEGVDSTSDKRITMDEFKAGMKHCSWDEENRKP